MSARDTYMRPNEGFRGEVTRACVRALRGLTRCPACDRPVAASVAARREHAEDCSEFRADVADTL